ncbi:glutathione S-transferase family protein [Rhodanobacter denitrificans]|uniref:glutathione S-transferase family protein n=1 Tax=Rhodanobacter denitrificans TaxID=666685 RepID=UPI000260C86A|nr:glutathione S-transferase family protein [Rhodanobacter denitrificans]EIL97819.1 glutathione S-transferase domain-containing protein [Rhodanobacter denitrificans]UJM91903.1 glutathione S-transferase family protein [Rhodanobacter denitrificans]
MPLQLYAHPFSSYCQKVLIALYENGTAFEWRVLTPDDAATSAEFTALWPICRMPLLRDGERTVMESSIIIEYLGRHHPGPVRLMPADAGAALEARLLDRFFDNYLQTPQQKIVFDSLRPAADRDPYGVREARAMLDTAYAWLDRKLAGRTWATGGDFSLADCAAAPALFYADWTHRIPATCSNVIAYRQRLLARPSFARAVDEARPYRSYFPLGAPERD